MRRSLVPLLVAVALAAASCGGGTTPLAVVNGQEIFLADIVEVDPRYEVIDRFEEAEFVDDLGLFVLLTAIETAAADAGVEVSDDDVDTFFESPPAADADTVARWRAAIDGGQMTEGQAKANARTFLIRREMATVLATDGTAMEELWEQSPQVFASGCVRHILTQTEEEARAAADRIAAGEDFASVANEVSTDTATEGGLLANPETGECSVPLSIFVPEFGYEATVAPLNQVTGPFVSDFGWHIILVEDRDAPSSLEDVRANLDRYLSDDVETTLLTAWINDALDDAIVEVDPSIGTWSETANAILPAEDG